jgi:hypothetical protein
VVEEAAAAAAAAAGGADADVNPTFSADDGTDQDSSERQDYLVVNHSCMMLYYVLKCLGRTLIRRHVTLSIPVWV